MKDSNYAPFGARNVFKTLSVAAAAIFMISSAVSLSFGASSAEPATVQPGETVNNQVFRFEVRGVSADGDTDTLYLEFPDRLNGSISANQASFDNASVTTSIQLVDGVDGDGVDDSFKFSTSPTGEETVTLNAAVDVSVDYPDTASTYVVTATVEDSSDETVSSEVATVQAGQTDGSSDTSGSEESTSDTTDSGSDSRTSGASSETDASETQDSESSDSGIFAAIGSFLMGLF